MRLTWKPAVLLSALALAMSGALPPSVAAGAAPPSAGVSGAQPTAPATEPGPALVRMRSFPTREHGVAHPTGLAWSSELGALLLPKASGTGTAIRAVTPDELTLGKTRIAALSDGGTLAVDPTTGTVSGVDGRELVSVDGSRMRANPRAGRTRLFPRPLRSPEAAAYGESGGLVVLDGAALVREETSGTVTRTPIEGRSGHDLRGLTVHPETGLLYTFDAVTRDVLEIDDAGQVLATHDASSMKLADVEGVAFAPSADATDDPGVLSLFIADARGAAATGEIVEASLDVPTVAALAVANTTLVRTVDTSAFNPPSPDPSGLAYLPGADRLFIADGEVDEMSIFEGSNLFATSRTGSVITTGVSQPWSDEPVGVGYNPGNNHLFVSDDDQKEVFEIVAGGDGRFGTGDDTVTQFDTNSAGNSDPEGIDYDSATNSIWAVDGVNREVFQYRAGADGRVGTSDDVRSHFDVGVYGARDPEGLAYDSVRDTINIVDDGSDTIYELDKSGALLNTISTSVASMQAAAGLAIAPSSTGSGSRNYYVVARGLDNDSHPTENDGRMYEFAAALPPLNGGNQGAAVNAGDDQSVVLPAAATLDGTVTDDGQPDPPGAVTTTWSKLSGPGDVTFGNASAVDTTATFSAQGTYVLRLSANDGGATSADDLTVSVSPIGGAMVTEVRIAAGSDDAEQALSGSVALTSGDLELTTDGSTVQVVGTRFANLQVPAGATITNAWVQFRTDEVSTGATSLTVRAENADNTPTYQAVSGNLTSRAVTGASVAWSPPAWNTVGETGAGQRTPNVTSLVQAVISRPGWSQGNALALQYSGTGRRTAEAFESGFTFAPVLHVEFSPGGGPVTNQAPVVNAGADATVTLPGTASLDGTVTDDGLPTPPGAVTTTWTTLSGPGVVTFGNASLTDTTASFSTAGTYVLRLTADDSALSSFDDVTVTVQPAGGGGSQTVETRVVAGSDDAEQSVNSGSTALTSADLELTTDGNTVQVVGTRFANLQVPAGATITNAWVQFRTDEVSTTTTGASSLTVRAENADNTATYQAVSGNLTSRAVTGASVAWSPPAWSIVGEAGAGQRTPNIASLVQAVVSRPGWSQGNALALQFSGTGRRTAEAFEGGATFAPLLHIEFSTGG